MDRILKAPRWIIENFTDIALFTAFGLLAILGIKLGRRDRGRLRELEKKVEEKQQKDKELEGKVKDTVADIADREKEIEALAEDIDKSKKTDAELKVILKKTREETDEILEGVDDEATEHDINSAVDKLESILNSGSG